MELPRTGVYKVTKGEFKGHLEFVVEVAGDRNFFIFTLFNPKTGDAQEFTSTDWQEFKKRDRLKRQGPVPESIMKDFLETGITFI